MSTNEGNVTRVTVELIITGSYRDDSASYKCSVSNLLNTVTNTVNLTVQCKCLSKYDNVSISSIPSSFLSIITVVLQVLVWLSADKE